jgi:hypothetical protein
MANSFSYRDLMIDGLYGTKVLISPALMGRDELSGSIFRQHFLLVTSPDSDGTVLPFDRGPAKLLTASGCAKFEVASICPWTNKLFATSTSHP